MVLRGVPYTVMVELYCKHVTFIGIDAYRSYFTLVFFRGLLDIVIDLINII